MVGGLLSLSKATHNILSLAQIPQNHWTVTEPGLNSAFTDSTYDRLRTTVYIIQLHSIIMTLCTMHVRERLNL